MRQTLAMMRGMVSPRLKVGLGKIELGLLGFGLLGLSACGAVFPYESSGSCPQMDQGVCASVREVYRATQQSGDHGVTPESLHGAVASTVASPVAPQASAGGGRGSDRAVATSASQASAPAASPQASDRAASDRAAPPAAQDPPALPVAYGADGTLPLRMPAEVMRIWIAPWVNKDGDLELSSYVFTELRERTWQIGGQSVAGVAGLRPLAPDQRVPSAVPSAGPGTVPAANPGQGARSLNAASTDARSIAAPAPTSGADIASMRPLVRASSGASPQAPQGGFWQTEPDAPRLP